MKIVEEYLHFILLSHEEEVNYSTFAKFSVISFNFEPGWGATNLGKRGD